MRILVILASLLSLILAMAPRISMFFSKILIAFLRARTAAYGVQS